MTGDEWSAEDREKYEQLKKKIQESHAGDHPTTQPQIVIQLSPGASAGAQPDFSALYAPTYRIQEPQPDGLRNLLEEIASRTLQNMSNGSRNKLSQIVDNCARSLPWHSGGQQPRAQPARGPRNPPPRPAPQRNPFMNINIRMPKGRRGKK